MSRSLKKRNKPLAASFLANNAKQKPQTGKVVAVGEGALTPEGKRLPMAVKVGDTVLYDKYAGSEVKYEGQDYPRTCTKRHYGNCVKIIDQF